MSHYPNLDRVVKRFQNVSFLDDAPQFFALADVAICFAGLSPIATPQVWCMYLLIHGRPPMSLVCELQLLFSVHALSETASSKLRRAIEHLATLML